MRIKRLIYSIFSHLYNYTGARHGDTSARNGHNKSDDGNNKHNKRQVFLPQKKTQQLAFQTRDTVVGEKREK